MSEEINVFKLEKPKSFNDLLAQKHRDLISEDEVKDAFHNLSQNIIDLSKLIQKKIWGD